MRHAVLGGGGIGGLLAAALARSGADVAMVMRPASLVGYDGHLRLESVVLGEFEVAVPATAKLCKSIDALWVATKATQVESAVALAAPEVVGTAVVIPLLNAVDHLALSPAALPERGCRSDSS